MSDIVIYQARKIVTMDPNLPVATHVAVRDGRILAVGDADCAEGWGGGVRDARFADHVLMPGFVEGHAHMLAGGIWQYPYLGYHDRTDPDGVQWAGLTTIEDVIARLRKADADNPGTEPLFAWGFDPIFLPTERLNKRHLDAVSTSRPIVVQHSNFHLLTANSAALALAQYTRETNVIGVVKDPDGAPSGEIQEFAAMFPIQRRIKVDFRSLGAHRDSIEAFGRAARRVGVTTCTDLMADLQDDDVATLIQTTGSADYPLRVVPMLSATFLPKEELVCRARDLARRSTEMLRLGGVKLALDGSIQGYTARLRWPGHVNGEPNGIWVIPPEQAEELISACHAAGVQMHIHTNGDEASDVAVDALERALSAHGWPDHRHTLQHGQMIDEAVFRRMAALGLCVNLFANHIWYFGDLHVAKTIGEDRARRMDACRSALDCGVPMTIHSDAPVTPMGPLMTAWCAVNRLTGSGRCLGPEQRISATEALRAITLGAAFTLKLDGEIGSIETGKRADFAILGEDPTVVPPEVLKDVPVLGTVSGGRVFLN